MRTGATPRPCARFQSTLPVWGATCCACLGQPRSHYFNPRSPCGERLYVCRPPAPMAFISIHAPRVGSDVAVDKLELTETKFQSTLPVWGATRYILSLEGDRVISIHAPRVGSDDGAPIESGQLLGFQSTLPVWGATAIYSRQAATWTDFNPRSPCGERLCWIGVGADIAFISIHAPRVGSDLRAVERDGQRQISIHAPRVGSDTA